MPDILKNGLKKGSGQYYKGKKDIKTGKVITEGVYFSNIVEDAENYCGYIEIPVLI